MNTLRFKQVDVFTQKPFLGNPVAVVLGGDKLGTDRMQRIAAWTNLSETTFVLTPSATTADYRLRIFTPKQELPFAGHPTIGSAHAVLESGLAAARDGHLRQECLAGMIDLTIEKGETGERIFIRTPKAKVNALEPDQINFPRTSSFRFHLSQYLLRRGDAKVKDWPTLNANATYYSGDKLAAFINWQNLNDIRSNGLTERIKMREVMHAWCSK